MLKITVGITELHEILLRDYGIEEPCGMSASNLYSCSVYYFAPALPLNSHFVSNCCRFNQLATEFRFISGLHGQCKTQTAERG